jgi:hypothetical protein
MMGLGALNDDLMGMLTLLEACVAGADLPAIGSALRGFGTEGADRPGTPLVKSALTPDGDRSYGMPRRPSMTAMALCVTSAPKVRRVWWPWPCQRSTATRKRAGRALVTERTLMRRELRKCRFDLKAFGSEYFVSFVA